MLRDRWQPISGRDRRLLILTVVAVSQRRRNRKAAAPMYPLP
jgi:hypothetical protein